MTISRYHASLQHPDKLSSSATVLLSVRPPAVTAFFTHCI